jgi:hypothetical protein
MSGRERAVAIVQKIRTNFDEYKQTRDQADRILIEALERIARGGIDSRSCAREAIRNFLSEMTEVPTTNETNESCPPTNLPQSSQ